ncbi:condensation domain-containing protein [Streptomyces bambusae]|uniref:condensation domain-containing protein n=1 Tax=Streptomyces bambusae TaxID=1550616 RepID=UPI001CFE8423|nr:condensation domain-containing protein [Streptomyces bambusae]MCB5166100.1 condensation domain-containing protein [Streptomyces bambusae]
MTTDLREGGTLPAYGMPVRALANGETDADGHLRRNPAEMAWNLLRVRGPLDTARLARAVEQVTLATDVLHLRLRATADGPRLVRQEPVPVRLETVDVPAVVSADGRLSAAAAAHLAPLFFDKPDLRHEPVGRVSLIRGTAADEDAEHLLAFSFDHSVLDGWALGLLIRAVAGCYRTGDHRVRGRGFEAFLDDLPDEPVRTASLARWTALLTPHPLPGPPLHLPSGTPPAPESGPSASTPPAPFRADATFDGALPEPLAEDIATAATRTGLSRAEVLFAATALAATLWSDGPQPLLSLRHGHARPEDVLVIGPLVEPCVLLPPSPEPSGVADWLTAHRRTNQDLPPTYGVSIREVAPLAPRYIGVNVLPPARPVALGPATRATTATRDFLAPLWPGERPAEPSTAAVWLNYYTDQPGVIEATITYDTAVLPDIAPFLDAVLAVAAAAAHEPDLAVTTLRTRLHGGTP